MFKITVPRIILYSDNGSKIFDFSSKYNLSYEDFKFPDIDKYRNIDINISAKQLAIAKFHRLSALANLKKLCEFAESVGIDLSKKRKSKKFIPCSVIDLTDNDRMVMMLYNFQKPIFNILDFVRDLYTDPINAEFKQDDINTDYLLNPLGVDNNNLQEMILAIFGHEKNMNYASFCCLLNSVSRNKISIPKSTDYNSVCKEILEDIVPSKFQRLKYEKLPYREYAQDCDSDLLDNWLFCNDWLYILDVMILCTMFNVRLPNPRHMRKLLGKNKDSKVFTGLGYKRLIIRFNYMVVLWSSYLGEYIKIKEDKNKNEKLDTTHP
ncbi:hypothetical protein [Francisella philomiragia]|uniref:hypothetical protein n=1 Tax=Francisella philomiragia TaxID=28110 RepID=UPI001B8C8B2B|nr:hypothetical protein [Francisella philomiragia]QUE32191.1 hypothetical protein IMS64_04080 [Francisella philomiragia]